MFSLIMENNYQSGYKAEMIRYLKEEVPRQNLTNDFVSFLEKIEKLEENIREINNCFYSLNKKYILLFSLQDFRSLFHDTQLKEEMLRYMKYKENIEDEHSKSHHNCEDIVNEILSS